MLLLQKLVQLVLLYITRTVIYKWHITWKRMFHKIEVSYSIALEAVPAWPRVNSNLGNKWRSDSAFHSLELNSFKPTSNVIACYLWNNVTVYLLLGTPVQMNILMSVKHGTDKLHLKDSSIHHNWLNWWISQYASIAYFTRHFKLSVHYFFNFEVKNWLYFINFYRIKMLKLL